MYRVRFRIVRSAAAVRGSSPHASRTITVGRALAVLLLGTILMTACGDPDETVDDQTGLTGGWGTAGCEFTRVPATVKVGGVVMPATPPALDAAIARIDQGGRSTFADSYAGIEVDQHRVRGIVYRVPSAAFDDFVRQSADNACILVRDAAHSTNDLAVWHDRVVADIPFWTSRGIRIVTIGARHDGVGVEVGTRDLDRARMELPARYGTRAPLVFVAEGPINPVTATPTLPTAAPQGG
ncbi:hypothetical protein ACWKSP_24105 [Micromonosporaceae bacterium Da 78-11]